MTTKTYSTPTDQKLRWQGLLENPYISKAHRHCLDGFKVRNLAHILKTFSFSTLLDVGCGLGEYARVANKGFYLGVDNSFSRVLFAQRHKSTKASFLQSDALSLPFKNDAFDATLLANTAHHLSDEQFQNVLREMKRVTRRYIILDDCVRTQGMKAISRFFYSLDRGTMFRTVEGFQRLLIQHEDLKLVLQCSHTTFPRLYTHGVFVLEVKKRKV